MLWTTHIGPLFTNTLTAHNRQDHPAVGDLLSDSVMQAITTNASGMSVCNNQLW